MVNSYVFYRGITMKYRSISQLESVTDLNGTDKVLISRYIGGTRPDDLKSRHIDMSILSSYMMETVNTELEEITTMLGSSLETLRSIV